MDCLLDGGPVRLAQESAKLIGCGQGAQTNKNVKLQEVTTGAGGGDQSMAWACMMRPVSKDLCARQAL